MMGTQGCTAEGWYGIPGCSERRCLLGSRVRPLNPDPNPFVPPSIPTVLCMLKLIPAPPPPPNWAR